MELELGKFISVINASGINDIIDILFMSFIIYGIVKLVRDTRAVQLLKGVVALIIIYIIAVQFDLKTMTFLMKNVFGTGIIAVLIVFQPELRRMLEHVARTKLSDFAPKESETKSASALDTLDTIKCTAEACEYLSKHKIGALMVFERSTKLGEIASTGTFIDAKSSKEMLVNVFFPNSPLHDGALLIRDGRLHSAGCFLPLSENYDISKEMGTRHRAGLGISENSDALVVIVSEETGTISVADSGVITRSFTPQSLEQHLKKKLLAESQEGSKARFRLWRNKNEKKQK